MNELGFEDLPDGIRVRLEDGPEEELWRNLEKRGGVKKCSEFSGYSSSRIYNWRSKDVFLPADFVSIFLDEKFGVEALKGGGKSQVMRDVCFPLEVSDELLTRVDISVSVNRDGVPVYITDERSLKDRFIDLLQEVGDVPTKVYFREGRFEIRYPKFLHQIFQELDYKERFSTRFDEAGHIEDDELVVPGERMAVEKFSGELFSRRKSFELALQKEKDDEISRIIGKEASRVESLLEN